MVRSFQSEAEHNIMAIKRENGWGHIRPNSVLVAAMGSHWLPACWAKVADMVAHTNRNGIYCGFTELMDRSLNPYDALGTMRNEAILMAQNEGFEWLCYVNNDIWPNPDALLRLIAWDLPVVAPYVIEAGSGRKLHGPHRDPDTGLQPIKWTVLSMLLFRTNVFNCTGPTFWSNAIGADEGYHFQILYHYGHKPYLDTNNQVQDLNRPTYPLGINRMSREERENFWEERRQAMLKEPDRRPVDINEKNIHEGVYWPFGNMTVKPAEGTATLGETGTGTGGENPQGTGPRTEPVGERPDGSGDDAKVADGTGNAAS